MISACRSLKYKAELCHLGRSSYWLTAALGNDCWTLRDVSLQQKVAFGSEARQVIRAEDKHVVYKGRFMLLFRNLVRMKIFQLSGVAVFAVSIATWLSEGGMSPKSISIAIALLIGCGMSASTLNFYSRRYIGELSILKNCTPPAVCLSVLDFWGHRVDNVVAISDVVPPLRSQSREALAVMAKQPLLPLQVSGDRQYYISLRHGILADKETLFNLMKGTYDPSRQPETTEKA